MSSSVLAMCHSIHMHTNNCREQCRVKSYNGKSSLIRSFPSKVGVSAFCQRIQTRTPAHTHIHSPGECGMSNKIFNFVERNVLPHLHTTYMATQLLAHCRTHSLLVSLRPPNLGGRVQFQSQIRLSKLDKEAGV